MRKVISVYKGGSSLRGGILALGIILLILGLILFFTGNNVVRQIEAYDFEIEGYNIPISELIKTLDSSAQRQYETGQQLIMFGSIFSIIGFILCIAGISAPKTEEKIIENKHYHITKSERRCPGCGRIISDDADFCQYCGKKFGQFSDLLGSKIYEKVKDFKEGKTDNQEPSTIDEEYNDSQQLPDIIYKTAHDAHYKDEDIETAYRIYNKIIEKYPESDEADFSKQQIENIEKMKSQQEKNKEKLDESESKKSSFCFECGKKLEGKTKFCPFCGTKQEES